MIEDQLRILQKNRVTNGTLLTAFSPPATTIMTPFKLEKLQRRLRRTEVLLSEQNRGQTEESKKRLADFVILNPYSIGYEKNLDRLLPQTEKDQSLQDNILLAKAMLITDTTHRSGMLKELSEKFVKTDGGIHAMYELAMLKIGLWKEAQNGKKEAHLSDARAVLTGFIGQYPKSIFSEQARTMLENLPVAE